MKLDAVPRSLVAVDIERYSGRDNLGQLELREGLRRVCGEAFRRIQVSPDAQQDQGDAFLILIPPDVAKARLVDDLVRELAIALRLYNRNRLSEARMRLRVAMHAGEVHLDGTGFGGASIVTVMRLIEADTLRNALKTAPEDLVVIVSELLHRDVVSQRYRGIDPAHYRRVQVARKEFSQRAWIRVPGLSPGPQQGMGPGPQPGQPPGAQPAVEKHPSADAGGVHFAGPATFRGPASIGGHAAGRDVNIQPPRQDA